MADHTTRRWLPLLLAAACGGFATAGRASDPARLTEPMPRFEPSFVVAGVPPDRATRIAAHAEATRLTIQKRLLGRPQDKPWQPMCLLQVHTTPQGFTSAVGIPPEAARGATSLEFAGDRVSLRRIDLLGDGTADIPDALDHELVHVVLGDRFIEAPPPRWADEGLAVLFDPPAIRERHEADFRRAIASGQTWPVRGLFELELEPSDLGRQRVFYGQSMALIRWLLERDGPATLLAFLEDAPFDGHTAALRRHYGFNSADELERAWQAALPAIE